MRESELIRKDFSELTTEELRFMLRTTGTGRIRPHLSKILRFYDIEIEDYLDALQEHGMKLTRSERHEIYQIRNQNKVTVNQNLIGYNVPDLVVCALYNIDFDLVGGVPYFDAIELEKARKDLREKIVAYEMRIENTKEHEEFTKLKSIDLVAMRIYRGYNRQKFASKILTSVAKVREMETTSPVPKRIADLYMKELNIKKRHIIQLRKVMTGKLDKVTDDRTIPKLIKLKVWRRDKGKCAKCGAKENLHYHHIEHFADGGQNTVDNLQLLCAECHAEEHKGEKSYHMLKAMAKR